MSRRPRRRLPQKPVAQPAAAPVSGNPNRYATLDRSRDYASVHGDFHGASFAQTGSDGVLRHYANDGSRVYLPGETPDPATPARPAPAPAPVKTAAPAPAEPEEDDPDDIPEDERPPAPAAPPAAAKADDGEVNLSAWAEVPGVNYLFAQIRDAIAARFNRQITNQSDAIQFLIDEGVADPEKVQAKWAGGSI